MKKLMFSLLLAGMMGAFFACQKDASLVVDSQLISQIAADEDAEAIGAEELPSGILSYVKTNFSPMEIDLAFRSEGKGYHLILEDGQEVFFNLNNNCLTGEKGNKGPGGHEGGGKAGHCIKGDTIATADLPQVAVDYVAANYAGNDITVVVVKPNGKLGVELSDGVVLLFDAEGNFIKECDGKSGNPGSGHGHGGHGGHGGTHHCTKGDTTVIDSLPQLALDYVAANYPSETITTVVVKPNGAYAVELSGGTILVFKADGTFLKECGTHGGHGPGWGGTEITTDELPAPVIDYLAANYPAETVKVAILTFSGKYFLRLSNGAKLVFDGSGNIIFDSGN